MGWRRPRPRPQGGPVTKQAGELHRATPPEDTVPTDIFTIRNSVAPPDKATKQAEGAADAGLTCYTPSGVVDLMALRRADPSPGAQSKVK